MNPADSAPDAASVRTRREILKTGAAAWIAAGAFPAILGAQDKAGDKPVIVGSGERRYEWLDNWPQRPSDKPFGNTHSVVETADGRIFIHHTGPESVHVYDPDGKFIESWGHAYAGNAHGMDLRKENGEEFLYLAPTGMHKAFKVNLKGDVLMTLDYPKDARNAKGDLCYASPKPYVPTFTAFGPGGDFYITDGYGAGYIHRYSAKGEYQQSWGGKGNADDQTACPHGIFTDHRNPSRPLLVVADREHHRLQYFTFDGKLDHLVVDKTAEERSGKSDDGALRRPCAFSVRGDELLVPDLRGRVTILDKENNAVAQLGDNPNASQRANNGVKQSETRPGAFCCPHGAIFDSSGNIIVAEWLPYGRVTKLKKLA